jgi:hypothetical protein
MRPFRKTSEWCPTLLGAGLFAERARSYGRSLSCVKGNPRLLTGTASGEKGRAVRCFRARSRASGNEADVQSWIARCATAAHLPPP